ncbi:hypothetical protein KSW92_18005, partial [Prevotella copri]|uniref:hypothetical protein n=1 Tax=Segatella copri TaxID=165179 RepID=UPI001C393822
IFVKYKHFKQALLFKVGSLTQVSQVSPTRPERAEAPSPGHRPGCLWTQNCRPVRAKAFKYLATTKLLPLQGALLIAIIPRAMPWEGTEKGTQF